MNAYKGFSLFNDIDDLELRTHNRARVLANMYEDNHKDGKLSPAATGTLLTYFQKVPDGERGGVQQLFQKMMYEKGFKV